RFCGFRVRPSLTCPRRRCPPLPRQPPACCSRSARCPTTGTSRRVGALVWLNADLRSDSAARLGAAHGSNRPACKLDDRFGSYAADKELRFKAKWSARGYTFV
ncbi:hypothetical protein EMIHUDRAFT_448099, partial [Emiliania huxleyi CCMP1516]